MKISEAFAVYKTTKIVAGGLSAKTGESYQYAEKWAIVYFGNIQVRKITQESASGFFEFLVKKPRPCSVNTARGYIICLRSVLKFCRRKGEKVVDPDLVIVPKREKRMPSYLEESQFLRFLEAAAEPRRGYSQINRVRNALMIKFLFDTGLRVSELCALNRNSIVNRHFVVKGKSKNIRPCFISEELEGEINTYLAMRSDDNPALFINGQNNDRIRPETVRRVFKRVCEESGFVGVHPHTMRHSFGTRLVKYGVDIVYVAKLLGHENLDVTKLYTHIDDARLRSIYDGVIK